MNCSDQVFFLKYLHYKGNIADGQILTILESRPKTTHLRRGKRDRREKKVSQNKLSGRFCNKSQYHWFSKRCRVCILHKLLGYKRISADSTEEWHHSWSIFIGYNFQHNSTCQKTTMLSETSTYFFVLWGFVFKIPTLLDFG